MVVMGKLHALCHRDPLTQKNKAQNSERKRTLTPYHFQGHRVCRDTFVFQHTMSIARLKAIKQHEMENRMCPCRAKVLPHNPTKLSDIKNVVRYILQYAEDHAILLPGRMPGYKRDGSLAATSIVDHKAGSVQTLPLHSISRLRQKRQWVTPFSALFGES